MSKPAVIVTITPEGQTTVETTGVQGPQCESLSAGIEAVLGVQSSNTRKPEYSREAKAVQPAAATQGAG